MHMFPKMISLGIHWWGLLVFILPPQFSFKNSTRVKTTVVFYLGGNLLRIQASNLSSVPKLNNTSRGKTSFKFLLGISIQMIRICSQKTAGGNLYIAFLFIWKLTCIFILRIWVHGVQGLHACVEDRRQLPGSVLACFSESCELRMSLAGSACQPSTCSAMLPCWLCPGSPGSSWVTQDSMCIWRAERSFWNILLRA